MSEIIKLRIIPNSSKNQFVGILDDAIKIKITAPPIEGKANTQLIKFIADKTNISKSKIEILSGLSSKYKSLKIDGISREKLIELLS